MLLLSAEDGLSDTIRPRLDALGANLTRIHYLEVLRDGDQSEPSDSLTLRHSSRPSCRKIEVGEFDESVA